MAYIIFYREYVRHLTEQQARATDRGAAIMAFVFIVFLDTASGLAMWWFGITG